MTAQADAGAESTPRDWQKGDVVQIDPGSLHRSRPQLLPLVRRTHAMVEHTETPPTLDALLLALNEARRRAQYVGDYDQCASIDWLAASLPSLLDSQRDAERWRFVAPYLAHRIRARNGKMELVFQEESRWEPKEISLPTNVAGGRTNELIEFAIDRGIAAASPSPEDR